MKTPKPSKFQLPFTTMQLMKVAAFGGVFVIGNAILMRWLVHKRLTQSPYYVQATDTFLKNRTLVDLVGEPVTFGRVNIDDNSKNFSTSTEARFEVPLKGTKTEGILLLSAVRHSETNQTIEDTSSAVQENTSNNSPSGWNLRSLEVMLKDKPNQKVILLKDQTSHTTT